jgi:uncharacterized protein (TIGR02391 family)
MNLKTHIRPELWQAISNTYESENYAPAVLDAFHHLSETLKAKSGLDSDGVVLVGQSLGGDTPRIKLTKLQSETDRNIQKGIEHVLRGLYMAIRNPRSHEQVQDSKQTADALIFFVDFVLGLLAESEEIFTVEGFVTRALDPDFVESDRYAELLAEEIPVNKRLDSAVALYSRRVDGDGKKLQYAFGALLNLLNEDELTLFLSEVSKDLKVQSDEKAIRTAIQILRPSMWPSLTEVARIRIENKLIRSVKEGSMDANLHRTEKGALGTWARDISPEFQLRDDFAKVLVSKLEDGGWSERAYVARYFFRVLPQVATTPYLKKRCIKAISDAIRAEDEPVTDAFVSRFPGLPDDWQQEFASLLADLTDPENPAFYLPDGTPFFKRGHRDDDIPF